MQMEAREWRISLRGLVKYDFIINFMLRAHLHRGKDTGMADCGETMQAKVD